MLGALSRHAVDSGMIKRMVLHGQQHGPLCPRIGQKLRSLGAGVLHILRVHILPNVLAPLIVATTLSVGDVILLESVLSFLGLGIQPPLASWGTMLSNAQQLMSTAPLLAIYPGAMIFLTVIACNLFGDALQQRFDRRAAVRV